MMSTAYGYAGGAEGQVAQLALEFLARNWEVCVVSLTELAPGVLESSPKPLTIRSLHMQRGVPDVRAVFRLRSILRDFRPDIVHCHMYHANILGRITRLVCPIPALISTAHNTRETSTDGGATWHKELLYRLTDPLSDQTTIICNAGYKRYLKVGAVPRNKLRLLPNGLETDFFSPSAEVRSASRAELGLDSEFAWLAVGRLVVQKDYPNLLNAMQQLKERNCVLLIAGDGPLEAELRARCAYLGLSNVKFCGVRQDISGLYNAADAFVMSSEWEGLPMALLEAAAMRLPTVATDVGGNAEIVSEGETGYLVPPKNSSELGAAMLRLMDQPAARRERMGESARQQCCERYGIAAVMDMWLQLYAECLRRNGQDNAALAARAYC
jgi:glycosyltransferase involved in cell wall biosynthesis